MNKENIKEALKQNDDWGIMYNADDEKRTCRFVKHKDILNYINELESENKRLQNDCADIANDYQEMGRFYVEKCEECDLLKQQLDEMWTFKTTQDGKCNILDIVRKVEREETVKKIFRKIDEKFCFFTDGKQSEEYEKGYGDGVLAVGKMITELAKQLGVDIKENNK